MTEREIAEAWAKRHGYSSVVSVSLRDGRTVYLLNPDNGEVIGVPQYIEMTPFGPIVSSYDESMALFDEPAYMDEG